MTEAQCRQHLIDKTHGQCEWCGRPGSEKHEISQGNPDRGKSKALPCCCLWLCLWCHRLMHRMPENRAAGLGLLRNSRPEDFQLAEFHRITCRNNPSMESVKEWQDRMPVRDRVFRF